MANLAVSDAHAAWIADGTKDTAPVTESTPAETVETVAQETPVVETPAPESAAPEAQSAPETPAAATPAEQPTIAEQAAAAGQSVQEFLEAKLGDKPFQLPKDVLVPVSRNGKIDYVKLDELRASTMMERDYRIKTQEVAQLRKDAELSKRIYDAREKARAEWFEEQRKLQQQAYSGTAEDRARYEAYLDQYQNNPVFKKAVDQALHGAMRDAEDAVINESREEDALVEAAQSLNAELVSLGSQYPSVDVERVRQVYARDLQSPNPPPLSRDAIERYFKAEVEAQERLTSPLQQQLKALEAKLAKIEQARAADAHNVQTKQAIKRATNPVAAPAGGAPPAPSDPSTSLKGKTLNERSQEWAALR